ncbi:MAG: undecaprenyldiphospho-muramoylpentapeptide beta-N-acetylglucosaminyltransferase [Flavobacteriales bacterium]|jgi:UDP-N-acetylglucosamine--N-acetylmuramyl-(pentapeptide) pyrophosphoryl-undecaprenol N-acetylglucosamine transferase
MPPLSVLLSGGGTGGHIFPAVAIAQAVKAEVPDARFLFVGAEGKMEMEKVPAAGFAITGLPIRGFQRGSLLKNIGLPWRLLKSLVGARRIVLEFRPDVAVGTGGYASGPVLAAAQRAGVPTVLQEQNSLAGATNRMLGKRASRVCTAYAGMERYFPAGNVLLTGNPVRSEVLNVAGKRGEALSFFGLRAGRPVVFITGGSLGARGINQGIAQALPALKAKGVQVIWQTGIPFQQQAEEAVKANDYAACKVMPFIARMDLAYAVADMVVARAGAISVSELSLLGMPSILVPLPTAAEDHQTQNAKALVERDAAVLVADAEAREKLGDAILHLVDNGDLRQRLSASILAMAKTDAAKTIAAEVIRLGREHALNKNSVKN